MQKSSLSPEDHAYLLDLQGTFVVFLDLIIRQNADQTDGPMNSVGESAYCNIAADSIMMQMK